MKKPFLPFLLLLVFFLNINFVYGDSIKTYREAAYKFEENVTRAVAESLDKKIIKDAAGSRYSIMFSVNKNGDFENFKITTSTNNTEIDEQITNAVKLQLYKFPLPKQPANYNEPIFLSISLQFGSQKEFYLCLLIFIPVFIYFFIFILKASSIYSFDNFIEAIVEHFSTIFTSLKRSFYIRKSSFATKNKNCYKLSNDNVVFIYNINEQIFMCNEIKTKMSFKIQGYSFPTKKSFNDFFDDVLYFFSKNTNCRDILKKLDTGYLNIIDLTTDKEDSEEDKETEMPVININSKIDINNSDAETIAKFPGINIIKAKKAVRYRDLKGGFKTKKEFFDQIKIEEHFKFQIVSNIEVGEYKKTEPKDEFEGRILDIE